MHMIYNKGGVRVRHHAARLRGRGGDKLRCHTYLYVCYKHIYRERERAEWTHSLAKVKCVCGTTRRA